MRPDWKPWLMAALVCALPLSAKADAGGASTLIAECGAADLPQAAVDSCLERVRVLEETEPSARLQSLEGQLERRPSGTRVGVEMEGAPPPPNPAPIADSADTMPSAAMPKELAAGDTVTEEMSREASGAAAYDEPPVADPPDDMTPYARASDEATDPQ